MSISAASVSELAIAAHSGATVEVVRKPPKKRQITAIPDATESPEPR